MFAKVRDKLKVPWDYARSHLWVILIGSVAILLLAVMLIFQTYLKRQYFNYLLSETELTEETMMDSMKHDLNNSLGNAVTVSSEIAINEDAKEYAMKVEEDPDAAASGYTAMVSEISSLLHVSDYLVGVVFTTEDKVLFEYGQYWFGSLSENLWREDNLVPLQIMFVNLRESLQEDSSKRFVAGASPAYHEQFPRMRLFHIAVPLVSGPEGVSDLEIMSVTTFRLDTMFSGALNNENDSDLVGYITDADGTIIYHVDSAYEWESLDEYKEQTQGVYLSEPLDYFGWTLHVDIDTASMMHRVNQIYLRDLFLYILLLIAVVVVWIFLSRRTLRVVGSIREAMTDISSGNLEQQIPIEGKHEIWALADQYNDMAVELKEQREETRQHYLHEIASIEEKNRAEKMALESQIDAHFLCNTLTALHYDALESGNEDLSQLLKQLSEMLHYTLSTREEFSTIGQEIKWAKDYLTLQKFRRMDLFDYEIRFPEEYHEWPCCKQFFQPFIENSISHGFADITSGGLIVLSGEVEEACLRMELYDNGCGMPEEVKTSVEQVLAGGEDAMVVSQHDSGYGIQNVITRLRMFYGPGFRVQLITAEGEGCRYIFWLPIPLDIEEDEMEEDLEDEDPEDGELE